MEIIHTIEQIRQCVKAARNRNLTVGLVPTMGALHEGHGSLIIAAKKQCGYVVISIFVNPTQFGPSEDYNRYPRTFDADAAYCRNLGVDAVFAPSVEQMYPAEQLVWVHPEKLTDHLCGASRPGHFRGVATVCTKLFNIVQPDIAYFGQKDAQQAVVIRRMVQDLNIPIQICVCPIIREPDGLAMSSRNRYLSPAERRQALCLYNALTACRSRIAAGQRNAKLLIDLMAGIIADSGGRIDYISIVDPHTLEPLEYIEQTALVALAVHIGNTRLIDNLLIDLNNLSGPV
ncbi:MAG TPA: pantoate--beta-alanine ligase [Anaerohalosphaeraceae bacterium]|nr:pantoate--beta-alanine ligase [Anaerohalosphaeraceae bacterium]HPO69265.1 pantoate--beta-alanine ligase [Anaerohalosphaeraceae bacterium]